MSVIDLKPKNVIQVLKVNMKPSEKEILKAVEKEREKNVHQHKEKQK